ncbi:MAG: HAMP domain-containing sensor histidine kinase [Turicibacter sp.]|nr:HAMP domain-containing sensor histidine kinase [Turicibacter sp.]
MRNLLNKISLSLHTALVILFIHLITLAVTWVLLYMGISFNWIHESIQDNPLIVIGITIISCIIIGSIISVIASRKMLVSIRQFIEATTKLASGDFSARLNMTHPPEYNILSENFNHMAEELAGIEVLRTDFINNFSHEFKTPIVSIKGFAEILKDPTLSQEERDEYLDIVIEESTRLASLATNVLTLSKVEGQAILSHQQHFNLGEQIRQCVLMLDSKLEKKEILLQADIHDDIIFGNKEMLNQVWLNLLDNAIKFTPSQGIIEISTQEKDDQVIVKISDTGCGIDAQALPKIFDKFYQEDRSHATMGNGLGLSIAHEIVTLHKGSIHCASTVFKGTTFTVSLPK